MMKSLRLRPTTMHDAAFLFRLRSDPETRKQSIEPAPPDMEHHLAWLNRTIHADTRRLFIAYDHDVPVGTCRLDYSDDGSAEMSITIDPAKRGVGYAMPMLRALRDEAIKLGVRRLTAKVRGWNTRSLRMFLELSMRPLSNDCIELEWHKP